MINQNSQIQKISNQDAVYKITTVTKNGDLNSVIFLDENIAKLFSNFHDKIQAIPNCEIIIVENEPSSNFAEDYANKIKSNVKIVFAIGGGSSIDNAKLFCFLKSSKNKLPSKFRLLAESPNILNLIVFSTTFATGAEISPAAIYSSSIRKTAIINKFLIPNESYYLFETIYTLPRDFRLPIYFDAICHSLEGIMSKQSTPNSNFLNREGINGIINNVEISNSKNDLVLLKYFDLTSNGSKISGANFIHALSSPICFHFKISHSSSIVYMFHKVFGLDDFYSEALESLQNSGVDLDKIIELNNEIFKIINLKLDFQTFDFDQYKLCLNESKALFGKSNLNITSIFINNLIDTLKWT